MSLVTNDQAASELGDKSESIYHMEGPEPLETEPNVSGYKHDAALDVTGNKNESIHHAEDPEPLKTGANVSGPKHDAALDVLGEHGRIEMTDEQSRLVRNKIDKRVLPLLLWVYFLQILDKNCVGYGANFGMIAEAHLVGNQYSLVSSSGFWVQLFLCMGPTAWLIVRVPTNILMSTCTFCWGVSMLGLAFSKSFGPLLANRFLLGAFEAVNIPLFTIITMTWYRRHEQPLRIGYWYGTNGLSAIFGSLLAWALSFATHSPLYVYQILFLTVGIATVITAPFIYFFLDNNPAVARFLTPEERGWAVERLRSNNTGVEIKEVKWPQVWETFTSPQTYLFFLICLSLNTGAAVTGTFGPLIIKGFGYDARQTSLLNMPFGVVQAICCLSSAVLAARFGRKGLVLLGFIIPCLIGSGLLYGLGRGHKETGPLLFGYYCLAFLFGGNPILFSWIGANTGGHTKKSLSVSLLNAGLAVGNIIGPLMFKTSEAPLYHPGLSGVLGLFIGAFLLTGLLVCLIMYLNQQKAKERVRTGKPANIKNSSNRRMYEADNELDDHGRMLGDQAFLDLTDRQNDEFVYTL